MYYSRTVMDLFELRNVYIFFYGTNVGLSQNDGPSVKCLVSAKMFNVYFYVYPMSI